MPPRAERTSAASPAPPRQRDWAGYAVGLVSLAALFWACRGAPVGVPAADDYDYLASLRFDRPLDWFGPMGSLWYWRPLSRQLYFGALGDTFFSAPLLVAALHGLLLAGFFVLAYRAARTWFEPFGAAAIAAFPLLAEPTRALIAWPTGAQPLLAMTLIALAIHEAAFKRAWSAALALLLALLSHEQALLAAPIVPLVYAARDRRGAPRMLAWTLAVCALYGAGRALAWTHGAVLPARGTPSDAFAALPLILSKSFGAQFDPVGGGVNPAVGVAMAVLFGFAIVRCTRLEVRKRVEARAPALLTGLVWFAAGILPLAFAAALWTPRHTSLPSLGLGLFLGGALACASPWLALGLTGVRLVALLAAPAAPAIVQAKPSAVPMSFVHLAKLQRTADSARRALLAGHPTLPQGTTVRWWSLPHETEIAFAGPKAVRVWYRDPSLEWKFWERYEPGIDRSADPILGFNLESATPAVLMNPEAVRHYQDAVSAWDRGDLWPAQQSFFAALDRQKPPIRNFTNESVRLMARIAFARGRYDRADSLNAVDWKLSGPSPTFYSMEAMLKMAEGDSASAEAAAQRSLSMRPNDDEARAVLRALGKAL